MNDVSSSQEVVNGGHYEQIGWRGTINAWECDEMGRLELRFYVAIAWQGALFQATELGWDGTPGEVTLDEQHIRFHRELRPNVPAHLHCGVIAADQHGAQLFQRLVRSDTGDTIATFRTTISRLSTAHDATELPSDLTFVDVPDEGRYRGLNPDEPLPDAPDLSGLKLTGRSVVLPQDCDKGVMRRDLVLGRVAEATPHLVGFFNLAAHAATGLSLGGASVECRLRYLHWPTEGDRCDMFSAIMAVDRRTQRLAHYMIDPALGRVFASIEVVALMLDLDRRRAATIPDELLATMRSHITPVAERGRSSSEPMGADAKTEASLS